MCDPTPDGFKLSVRRQRREGVGTPQKVQRSCLSARRTAPDQIVSEEPRLREAAPNWHTGPARHRDTMWSKSTHGTDPLTETTVAYHGSRLARELGTTQASLPGLDLKGQEVVVLVEDETGVVHADVQMAHYYNSCYVLHQGRPAGRRHSYAITHPSGTGPIPHTKTTRTIASLAGERLCTTCDALASYLGYGHPYLWISTVKTYPTKYDAKSAAKTLRTALHAVERHLERYEQITPGKEEAAEALAEELRQERRVLKDLLRAPRHTTALVKKAKVALAGKAAVEGGYVFEEDLVLSGIERYVPYEWNDTVKGIVETYSISGDVARGDRVVLKVPRFMHEYVMSSPKSKKQGARPSATLLETDDLEVVETAAALWAPGSEGALASLAGALQAARCLT